MADPKSGLDTPSSLTQRSFLPSFIKICQRLRQLLGNKLTNGGEPPSKMGVASRPIEGGYAPRGGGCAPSWDGEGGCAPLSARIALKKGTTSLRSEVNKTSPQNCRILNVPYCSLLHVVAKRTFPSKLKHLITLNGKKKH